ncbi:MAG: hypothetical protein ACNI27_13260 [Desulfovibrio sp.]
MQIGSMTGSSSFSATGMQGMQGMRGQRGGPPPGGAEKHAEEVSTNMIDELDTNGDGVLSADELSSVESDFFSTTDADGDGLLTQEELQSGVQSQMEDMKSRFEAGAPTTADLELMQEFRSFSNEKPNMQMRQKAAEAYSASSESSSYNADQMLLEQLNVAV